MIKNKYALLVNQVIFWQLLHDWEVLAWATCIQINGSVFVEKYSVAGWCNDLNCRSQHTFCESKHYIIVLVSGETLQETQKHRNTLKFSGSRCYFPQTQKFSATFKTITGSRNQECGVYDGGWGDKITVHSC